ncbi:ATP-binding cassette domain-containing protein, partial [Salmonella enterica]|uniref:ATP-binding cassette domain-containing protein n=1 Tax=Salmonella enterica TaxID=28901 RepID=UPI0020C24144
FSYSDGHDVIYDISFECPQGTVTALVGPSGSGKSTLAHLLPRFYDVRKGKISIGGIDIRKMTSRTLLSSMSLVFQDI